MHEDNDLLTVDQLGAYLHMTNGQLSQLRYKGTGPPFVKVGRSVRYRWGDVQEWLRGNTRTITGPDTDRG